MSDWAIAEDGSCDFMPNMDLSNAKVVMKTDTIRVFRKVLRQRNSTKHILEWGEKIYGGIFVWSIQCSQSLRPRATTGRGARRLRFAIPQRNSPGARRNLNADMKRLQISRHRSPTLTRLGYTTITKVKNHAVTMGWCIAHPGSL